MSSRRVKQSIYGIFYFAILCGIAAGVYVLFLRPGPSCFDGIQDQGEQGIDCGGPCARPCASVNVQPIVPLGGVSFFSPVPGIESALVKLENANASSGASSFDYTIMLYGADGSTTAASVQGSSFIYPNEVKYIVVPRVSVATTVASGTIAIGNIQWTPASRIGQPPSFSFTNVTNVPGQDGLVTVSGNITNGSVSSFATVIVDAIFENAFGAPVGASQTQINNLAPGATQPFSISYPLMPNEAVSNTQLKAYAE
jgi:hypothetical protein